MPRAERQRRRDLRRRRRNRERVRVAYRESLRRWSYEIMDCVDVDALRPTSVARWSNTGWCSLIAEDVQEALDRHNIPCLVMDDGKDLATLSTDKQRRQGYVAGHVWIYAEGLHFDSESMRGVRDWRDLAIFRRARECGIPVVSRLDPGAMIPLLNKSAACLHAVKDLILKASVDRYERHLKKAAFARAALRTAPIQLTKEETA